MGEDLLMGRSSTEAGVHFKYAVLLRGGCATYSNVQTRIEQIIRPERRAIIRKLWISCKFYNHS
jgi:hypothetical protein